MNLIHDSTLWLWAMARARFDLVRVSGRNLYLYFACDEAFRLTLICAIAVLHIHTLYTMTRYRNVIPMFSAYHRSSS